MHARWRLTVLATGLLVLLTGGGVVALGGFADVTGPVLSTTPVPTASGPTPDPTPTDCPCSCAVIEPSTTPMPPGFARFGTVRLARTEDLQLMMWVRIDGNGNPTLDLDNDVAANPERLRDRIKPIEVGNDPKGCYFLRFSGRRVEKCTKAALNNGRAEQWISGPTRKEGNDDIGAFSTFTYTFGPKPKDAGGRLFLIDIVCTLTVP